MNHSRKHGFFFTNPGHYMYTEASLFAHKDIAHLVSPYVVIDTSFEYHCLTVWYHMRGRDIYHLKFYRYYANAYRHLIAIESYNRGPG